MILPMEGIPLTRAYLNSLTDAELSCLAENLMIDTSLDLNRFSLIQEMLEVASPDWAQLEPDTEDLISTESVPLPKQYNFTFIELMIRDPFWAFTFWEIKASDKEQFEGSPDFNGYYLKVSPLNNSNNDNEAAMEQVFKVPVKPDDTARYLGLTPITAGSTLWTGDRQYKVEFCVSLGKNESVLAVSKPVRLPGLPEFSAANGNQLISLSGYEDFRIIRKNERLHRIKSYE